MGQHPSHRVRGERRATGPGPRGTMNLSAPGAWPSPPTPAPAQHSEPKAGMLPGDGDQMRPGSPYHGVPGTLHTAPWESPSHKM